MTVNGMEWETEACTGIDPIEEIYKTLFCGGQSSADDGFLALDLSFRQPLGEFFSSLGVAFDCKC